MEWIAVAFGGGLGAVMRYLVQQSITKFSFPAYWATAVVNVLGSFLLGLTGSMALESSVLLGFFAVGMLGAFTTFSTFAFDLVKLIDRKKWMIGYFYLFANLAGGIAAFWLGWRL